MNKLIIPNSNSKNTKAAEGTLPYIVGKYKDDYLKIIEDYITDVDTFDPQEVKEELLYFFKLHKNEMNSKGKDSLVSLRNTVFRGASGRKAVVNLITNHILSAPVFERDSVVLKDLSELKGNYQKLN